MKPHFVLSLFLALLLFIGSLHAEDCCKDGDTKADEDDCTQYYVCCTGQFVLKSCDDKEYWNATEGVCKEDNGECIGGNTNCEENTIIENPSDCAGYLKCVNDDWVPVACADGYYFNNGICVLDDNAVCLNCVEGCTKEDLDDCTKYRVCSNGKYITKSCSTGDYWNADKKACEPDEGQCNGNNSTCKDGDLQENPSDCAGYQKCENNSWLNISCFEGAYYDKTYNACVVDTEGICVNCVEGNKTSDKNNCAQYRECINGKYVIKSCDVNDWWNGTHCTLDNGECNGNNSTCKDGDKQYNPSDCAGYQICENNSWLNISCSEGSYYDKSYNACVVDTEGICVNCVEGNKTSDKNNCAQYRECINGKYVTKSCDVNDWWNGTHCTLDNGECNGNNSTCTDGDKDVNPANCAGYLLCNNNNWLTQKCPEGTYFDKTQCVYDRDGVCLNKTCDPECCDYPDNWTGRIEGNCSMFIQCVNGFKYEQTCPENLQFNNKTGQCDYPKYVDCEDGSLPPSGPSAGPSGTYCESHGRCVGKDDGAMLEAVEGTCGTTYIVCQCECEVELTCPSTLVFNLKIRSCDYTC
ncbi:balbiani ring protein 3 [Drosophila tropicalis]|uniref:balbiani ring protein 3 n=1 Tax=Drosophila tropicalis TaxID=46794 RepID=UPI0035ABB7C1